MDRNPVDQTCVDQRDKQSDSECSHYGALADSDDLMSHDK